MSGIRIYRADGTNHVPDLPVPAEPFRFDAANLDPLMRHSPMFHMDAAATLFMARSLEEIDPVMYAREYAKLEAFELVQPRGMNPGADFYTYRETDGVGKAKVTRDYSTGHPLVEVSKEESRQGVIGVLTGYQYNLQELRKAMQAGESLDTERAVTARRIIAETTNRITLLGYAEFGITGLFNQSTAQSYTLPADGNSNGGTNSTQFKYKTPVQIERDIQGILNQIPEVTQEIENAKRVLLPYAVYRYLAQTNYSTNYEKKILAVLRETFPGVEFRGAMFLETAGASGVGRLMAYDYSREKIETLLPIPFEQFAPFQPNSMVWQVTMHARIGGLVNRRPKAMLYADGC